MENRRENIDRMTARLKELLSEICELEKSAEKAVAELKAEYRQQINELFLKEKGVKQKLSKISTVSGNAWEDMKAGAELSWEVFEDSVKNNLKKKK
jgi:hypothetical protein